jgi:CspA family cold shock protein
MPAKPGTTTNHYEERKMNYKDRWETDDEGNRFVFTVEMQKRLVAQGLPPEPEHLGQLRGPSRSAPPREADRDRGRDRVQDERRSRGPAEGDDRDSDRGGRDRGSRRAEETRASIEEPTTIQIDPVSGKYLGRLKWYNASRGYGFIARGGGEDIFFHKSDVLVDPETLAEGTWILYDVEETNKGLEAGEVEVYEQLEEEE